MSAASAPDSTRRCSCSTTASPSIDSRFVESDRRIDEIDESIEGVDQNALDELKDKMSTAVGEAMLVRIEMERLEKASTSAPTRCRSA